MQAAELIFFCFVGNQLNQLIKRGVPADIHRNQTALFFLNNADF